MDKLREDENVHLDRMTKTEGFRILQKMSKEFEEINIKNSYSENISQDERLLKIGEIRGMRKLLQQVVSRSENETKTPSWTETKE